MWYFYVVKCNDNSFYAGVTTNLNRRINEHNTSSKGAKYTKTRRPVKLIFFQEVGGRSEAQQIEASFKKLNRKQKEEFIIKYST
jgi:putative endonuclease